MPIYEYQCQKCHHHLEALQKFSDKPLRECPECGKHTLLRLMSAPMFRLAGSGWYETDFKSDKENKRNLAGKDDGPPAESRRPRPPPKGDKPTRPTRKSSRRPSLQRRRQSTAARKPAAKPVARAKPAAKKVRTEKGRPQALNRAGQVARAGVNRVADPTSTDRATTSTTQSGNGKGGRRSFARRLRNHLIAGLLIWIPVMVTVWVIRFLSRILDQSLVLLPPPWRPEALVGQYIPGVGIILSFLLLVLTGIVVRNLFGGQIVAGFENLVRRIPVIGAVYGGAKTFSETVLTDKGKSFKQVVMVEFPRKGLFSVGFITSEEHGRGPGQDRAGRGLRLRADHAEPDHGLPRPRRPATRSSAWT